MKKLLQFELVMLTTATVAGCSALPNKQEIEAAPASVTAFLSAAPTSCIERSAAALPPKHPIVELAWCIAETDELFDPDHLFRETLGISNYKTSEGITWGIKTGGDPDQNANLPKGIRYFTFLRRTPKGNGEPGNRNFSIDLEPKDSCVRMSDVVATFGVDSWLTAIPIAIPSPAVTGGAASSLKKELNPYRIFYKSPRFFRRDISGSVSFFFRNQGCVDYISLQRDFDFNSYLKLQGAKE